MAFENAKRVLGMETRRRRFAKLDRLRELEEISDPHTLEDDRRQSIREWMGENKILVATLAVAGLVALGFLISLTAQFGPMIASDWRAQLAGYTLAVAAVAYQVGWRHHRGTYTEFDVLTLYEASETGDASLTRYYGRYLRDGEDMVFVPFAGIRHGRSPSVYRVGDLGGELLNIQGTPVDRDDPATILLKPEIVAVRETDTNTEVAQLTDGIEPRPYSAGSTLEASWPTTADEEALERMAQDLEEKDDDVERLHERNDKLRSHIHDLIDDEHDFVEKRVQQEMAHFKDVLALSQGRVPPSEREEEAERDRDAWRGGATGGAPGPTGNGSRPAAVQEVEAELEADEEDDDDA